ncbi:MAG TPA: S-layer homology domain-containing protein [Bacillota bacterium]|nr:S-layer homology domain-containing protein [Bacillota bacterium]
MFNLRQRFTWILLGILLFTIILGEEVQAQPVFPDIQGNWAEQSILDLTKEDVLNGYPDGTFQPDKLVTRAEFAKMISKTFKYDKGINNSFPDTSGNWAEPFINRVAAQKVMNAYSDGSFKPEGTLNRAQVATMMNRIIHLGSSKEKYNQDWPVSFLDVPANYWGYRYIEIANKLKVLPPSYKTRFQPDKLVTRAEAAWMVRALNQLEVVKGKIIRIDDNSGLLSLQTAGGDAKLSMITPETVILRNYVTSNIDALVNGDETTAIADPSGNVIFVKAFGEVTKNDLLSRLSSMTKGKLTNEQISALVSGDWDTVKNDLKGGLYNQMIEMGLTPAEAESIMVQDWSYLDTLSRDRLAQAISNYLGITLDFSQALLARDMEKIKEYGKIELATMALSKLLGNNNSGKSNVEEAY